MKPCKPVSISKNAFLFCKIGVAVIIWVALILRNKELVLLSFLILLFSAILKVQKAPMIWLYTNTIDKIKTSEQELVDENGMRFAHSLGAILTGVCVILLYFVNDFSGWVFLFVVAIAKTAGAMGFCTALKLYGCISEKGTCCRLSGGKDD